MFKLFQRQNPQQSASDLPQSLNEPSDNESSLADENDEEVLGHLGNLSLEQTEDHADMEVNSPEIELFSESDLSKNLTVVPTSIHFEVIDAKIISSNKSKFVMYTILLRNNISDLNPVSIEKRYSKFEQLNSDMKKTFPQVMHDVSFPRKLLSGNFKAKTIAERSRSFEQYLCHLVMIQEVRLSPPFAPFFYDDDWKRACDLILKKKFAIAVVILRKVLEIQRKLLGDVHGDTVLTLCAITLCYINCSNDVQSQLSSRLAIKSIHNNDESEFLLPLLNFCIRLSWNLGKEKQDLESKLAQMKSKSNFTDCKKSLQDLVYEKILHSLS